IVVLRFAVFLRLAPVGVLGVGLARLAFALLHHAVAAAGRAVGIGRVVAARRAALVAVHADLHELHALGLATRAFDLLRHAVGPGGALGRTRAELAAGDPGVALFARAHAPVATAGRHRAAAARTGRCAACASARTASTALTARAACASAPACAGG